MLSAPGWRAPVASAGRFFLPATLDDASRLMRTRSNVSQGLTPRWTACKAIAARGIPVRLPIDNASMYRSPATRQPMESRRS